MNKAQIMIVILLIVLMLTGCQNDWDESQSMVFPDADSVLAVFHEQQAELEQIATLLLSKPVFWSYIDSRSGGKTLTSPSRQAPDYLNFFTEEEWERILLLFSDVGVRNLGALDFDVSNYTDQEFSEPLRHMYFHFLIAGDSGSPIRPAIQFHYVSDLEYMPDAVRTYKVNGTLLWQEGHWFARRYPVTNIHGN